MRNAIEHAMRRVLHVYWRMTRGLTLGVRALVIDDARRIFLVNHTYVRGWHLPGGGVEPGETLLAALARELVEEGNIELTGPPHLHGMFFNGRVSRRDHVACFVIESFRAERAAGAQPRDRRRALLCARRAARRHHRRHPRAHRRGADGRAGERAVVIRLRAYALRRTGVRNGRRVDPVVSPSRA